MPSDRVQRRIDRLLDEAETAADAHDWQLVDERVRMVLRLDVENTDALAFAGMVEEALADPEAAGKRPPIAETQPPEPSRPLPESFVGGRYQVTDFLGEGGRKQVYLAHDTRLDRDVAFAVIKTEGLDATGRQRIQREAEAMGRLSGHPHIVTIYDVGEADGQPYIVSEYMAGGDVEALVAAADDHQLDLERAIAITDQVAQALEHAHADGVVHRDVKPGNIWLADDGTAKLGDFGLAFAASDTRMTTEGTMLGTVAYMPPEQALGNAASPQSDLYALGCSLYEMVTGRPPFAGDDAVAVISQHLNTTPVAPSWNREDCPPALEELIETLLAKPPEDRPDSAEAVRSELANIDLSTASGGAARHNPLDRLARGVFVGREEEMQRLRRAFDNALGGHGELVMLVGGAGIGKTRTTYELETFAKMRGAQVHWGRIHEDSGAPSYWPWVQVGRSIGLGSDPGATALIGDGVGELVRLFPELRATNPNIPEPPEIDVAEAAQFRLFDAFSTFLRNSARAVPLMLVLDDLHWSDKPSLQLLQHLARELAGMRVLVVGTFRDTDLVRTHPLSETLATLNREVGFERITLRGLTHEECARYVRGVANVEPSPPVLQRIFEETEGNPFFLSEVVNLMAQEGTLDKTSLSDITIPDGVREALGRRLDRISEAGNALLQIAAVVGREFDYETLALLSDAGDEETLRLVEEALEARVVEELPQPGSYRFTHHLMQETLLNELSLTRRIRIQGQIGDALEQRYGERAEEQAARLAHHYSEAATLSHEHAAKAVFYSIAAAQQAEAAKGWAEAARHYERCLSLIETTGESHGTDIPDLLLTLGRCASSAGQGSLAASAVRRALDAYEERGDGLGMARAAFVTRDPRTMEFLDLNTPAAERALETLGDQDPRLRAQLLLQAAMYERGELADRSVEEASSIVEQYGYADLQVLFVDREMHTAWDRGDAERANDLARRAAQGFMDQNNLEEASHLLGDVSWTLQHLGRLDEALVAVDAELTYAREHYLKNGEQHGLFVRGTIARMRGDRETWQALEPQLPPAWGPQLRAADAEVHGKLDEFNRELRKPMGLTRWALVLDHASLAHLAWSEGDNATALRELDSWRDLVDSAHVFGGFRGESYARAMQTLLALGSKAEIRAALDGLDRLEQLRVTLLSGTSLDRVRGLLALRLGEIERADRELRRGTEWTAREGCEVERALCELGLAQVALARGEQESARREINAAVERLRNAGATGYLERALRARLELQGLASADVSSSIDAVAAYIDAERPDLSPQSAPDGTVTLLFSDIENSTARTAELGDAKWMALLREHNAIVRGQLAAHRGFEVKSMGDGFMLAFGSAVDGLRCAIGMQRAFASHNASEDEAIVVRIGVHTGEAIKEADDFFGSHVNLAARVAGVATGEEILVSGLLKALTESAGEFTFDEGREVELKGISGPQQVYTVVWPPA